MASVISSSRLSIRSWPTGTISFQSRSYNAPEGIIQVGTPLGAYDFPSPQGHCSIRWFISLMRPSWVYIGGPGPGARFGPTISAGPQPESTDGCLCPRPAAVSWAPERIPADQGLAVEASREPVMANARVRLVGLFLERTPFPHCRSKGEGHATIDKFAESLLIA